MNFVQSFIETPVIDFTLRLVASFVLISLVESWRSGNVSTVDRLWSIVPCIYAWVFILYPIVKQNQTIDIHLIILGILITIWSLRLTRNFARKGGYSLSEEDYRWPIIRNYINNWFLFQLFNVFFIAIYQHLLLWSLTLPIFAITQISNIDNSISTQLFRLATNLAFLLFLYSEHLADEQQFTFQQFKHQKIGNRNDFKKEDLKNGFLTAGVFEYSRHLNFFGEQMIWWTVYFAYVIVVGESFELWPGGGALLLSLLFQGSTWLTELLTASKYAEYRQYQQKVAKFIPFTIFFVGFVIVLSLFQIQCVLLRNKSKIK